ncbi:MAG: hypothetical protein GSR87_02340 [Desulfurococcales archaeon]|nr:hypothetical protein [Desulfurococcales archaeon]
MRILGIETGRTQEDRRTCCGIELFGFVDKNEKPLELVPSTCFSVIQFNPKSNEIRDYLIKLLKLLMITNKLYNDEFGLIKIANYLNFVKTSTFYPYNFEVCVYHDYSQAFDEEESQSSSIASIHRLAKTDVKLLESSKAKDSMVQARINITPYKDDNNKNNNDTIRSAIAAVTTAGFLSSEARVGYYLSILSAQSLVYMLSQVSGIVDEDESRESILQGFSALTSYIYTVYHRRLSGKEPELYRHIIPAPPRVNLDFRILYNELYANLKDCFYGGCPIGGEINTTLDSIQQISTIITSTVKGLLDKYRTGFMPRNEVVLGRFFSYNSIRDAVKCDKYDLAVMFATEQWSPLHSLIGRLTVRDSGRLLVLYTQSSLTSTITSILIERDLVEKQSSDSVGVSYVPVSITDAFVAENVGRIIDGYIRDYFGDKRVRGLVLAMGPASLSVPLYMYGLGREEEGWRSFLF